LSEFDRESGFVGLSVGCEDIEDQFGSVDDFRADGFLKVSCLGWCQIVIEQNDVSFEVFDEHSELFDFSPSEVGRMIRVFALLKEGATNGDTGGVGEAFEFIEWVIGSVIVW
jgi:hypothetical protein